VLCLRISVNGTVVLTAGAHDAENISAHVHLLPEEKSVCLNVEGLAATSSAYHEFMMWPAPAIKAGDEISIRAVELESGDVASAAKAGTGAIAETPAAGPVCYFCGKKHNEVETMISGRRAFICGTCITELYADLQQ